MTTQEVPTLPQGKDLLRSFTSAHHARRNPQLRPEQRQMVDRAYEMQRMALSSITALGSADPTARRDARYLLEQAKADDVAYRLMPSVLGYNVPTTDEMRAARRRYYEDSIEAIKLQAQELAGQGDLSPYSGKDPEQLIDVVIEKKLQQELAARLGEGGKKGSAFTRVSSGFLGLGERRAQRVTELDGLSDAIQNMPVSSDAMRLGNIALQVLDPHSTPIKGEGSDRYFEVIDPLTGKPSKVPIPREYLNWGPEQGRAVKEAMSGLDPYGVHVLRQGLGTDVVGSITKGAMNTLSSVLHPIGLDYVKGKDYDVDSLIGPQSHVWKLTGNKEVDRNLMLNPVAVRMALELNGDVSMLSQLGQGLFGLADFMATQWGAAKVLGAGAKALAGAGKVLPTGLKSVTYPARAMAVDARAMAQSYSNLAGQAARGNWASGLEFGARSLGQETLYGALSGALDANRTWQEGLGGGVHEGLAEIGFSKGARVATNLFGGTAKVLVGGLGSRIQQADRQSRALAILRRLDGSVLSKETRQQIMSLGDATFVSNVGDASRILGGAMPSSMVGVRDALQKRLRSATLVEEALTAADVWVTGLAVGAHFKAMEAAGLDTGNPFDLPKVLNTDGYLNAFVNALNDQDVIMQSSGVLLGAFGASVVNRKMIGGSKLASVDEQGMITEVERKEALDSAASIIYRNINSGDGISNMVQLALNADELARTEAFSGSRAPLKNATPVTDRILAQQKRGVEAEALRTYMEEQGLDSPFTVNYAEFEKWAKKRGETMEGRAARPSYGLETEYVNAARGLTRRDEDYVYSAGELFALRLFSKTPTSEDDPSDFTKSDLPKWMGGIAKTVEAVRLLPTEALSGLMKDLRLLPQRVRDLEDGEHGASSAQVEAAIDQIRKELRSRLGFKRTADALPRRAAWERGGGGGGSSGPTPPSPGPQPGTQGGGGGAPASSALLAVQPAAPRRVGPTMPGTAEAAWIRMAQKLADARVEKGTPPEAIEGRQKGLERLSDPEVLAALDVDGEAQDAAKAQLKRMAKGETEPATQDLQNPDVESLKARLQAQDPGAILDAEEAIATLRAQEQMAMAQAREAVEQGTDADIAAQLDEVATTASNLAEQLEEALGSNDQIAAGRAEAQQLAQQIQAELAATEEMRQERLKREYLEPRLEAVGTTLEAEEKAALEGTSEQPEWVQEILRGESRMLTDEERAQVKQDLMEPYVNRPMWVLQGDAEAYRQLMDRHMGEAETFSAKRAEAAAARARQEAASEPEPMMAGGPATDAELRTELSEAAMQARVEGDEATAAALEPQAAALEKLAVEEVQEKLQSPPETEPLPYNDGTVFDPNSPEELALFQAGQDFGARPGNDGQGGWKQTLELHLALDDSPEGKRRKAALEAGIIVATSGNTVLLRVVDRMLGLSPSTSKARYNQMGRRGLEENIDRIREVVDAHAREAGIEPFFDDLRQNAKIHYGVASLGLPLRGVPGNSTSLAWGPFRDLVNQVVLDGHPSEAEKLRRARKLVEQGIPGVKRILADGRAVRSSSSSGSARDSEQDVLQQADALVSALEAMRSVIPKGADTRYDTLQGTIAAQLKKRGLKGGAPATARVARAILEDLSGASVSVRGRDNTQLTTTDDVGMTPAEVEAIIRHAGELAMRLREHGPKAMAPELAAIASTRRLVEDVAESLKTVTMEDGTPLIAPDASVDDAAQLRVYLRALASPKTQTYGWLREMSLASGMSAAQFTDLARRATGAAAAAESLLQMVPSEKNANGSTMYQVMVDLLARQTRGKTRIDPDEIDDINFSDWGVEMVRRLDNGDWVISNDGMRAASNLIAEQIYEFGAKFGGIESEADVAYMYAGLPLSINPRWRFNRDRREPVHVLHAAGRAVLRPMLRAMPGNRWVTEHFGRRSRAVGKGQLEQSLDITGKLAINIPRVSAQAFIREMEVAAAQYLEPLPREIRELAMVLIENGKWRDVKSPSHLAKALNRAATPEVHRLFDALVEYNWLTIEAGRQMVLKGLMSREQFQQSVGGERVNIGDAVSRNTKLRTEYVMEALRPKPDGRTQQAESANPDSRKQREGLSAFVGREMSRSSDPLDEARTRVFDPMALLPASIKQSAARTALYDSLRRLRNEGIPYQERNSRIAKSERAAFFVTALPPDVTHDPISGRKARPIQHEMYRWVEQVRAQMMEYQKTKARHETERRRGIPIRERTPVRGIRPNPARLALLESLVPTTGKMRPDKGTIETVGPNRPRHTMKPSGEFGFATTVTNLQDLQALMENFYVDDSFWVAADRTLSAYASRWRRTRTAARLGHIMMSQQSAFYSNVVLGKTSLTDVIAMSLGMGPYAQAGRAQQLHREFELSGDESLKANPELDELLWFYKTQGYGSQVRTIIEAERVSDTQGAFDATSGIPLNEGRTVADRSFAAMLRRSIADHSSATDIDRSLASMVGSSTPEREVMVRAAELLTGHYYKLEMWHKYAAYLALKRDNPLIAATEEGRFRLAQDAAAGTGDYSETNPWYQQWSTRFRMGPIAAKGSGSLGVAADFVARTAFAMPFLSYTMVMVPVRAANFFTAKGFMREAIGLSMLGGMTRIAALLYLGDDEEERRVLEAAGGTDILKAGEWHPQDWLSSYPDMSPRAMGGIDLMGRVEKGLRNTFHHFAQSVGNGSITLRATGDWFSKSAVFDTTNYIGGGPVEIAIRAGRQAPFQDAAAKPAQAAWALAKAALMVDGLQGWQAQQLASLLATTRGLLDPERSKKSVVVESMKALAGTLSSDLSPTTWQFSPTILKFFEASALRGQPIGEAAIGIAPMEDGLNPFERLVGAAARSLASVRFIPERGRGPSGDPTTLDEVKKIYLGEQYRNAPLRGRTIVEREYERAGRKVDLQMRNIFRGAYSRAVKQGWQAAPLNDYIFSELETVSGYNLETKDGLRFVKPNVKTTLAAFLRGLEPGEQDAAIYHIERVVDNAALRSGRAMSALNGLVEENAVDPALAMRMLDGLMHPNPARSMQIILEDMDNPRNHGPLSKVWKAMYPQLAEQYAGKKGPEARLFKRLEAEFAENQRDGWDAPLGIKMFDVAPELELWRN